MLVSKQLNLPSFCSDGAMSMLAFFFFHHWHVQSSRLIASKIFLLSLTTFPLYYSDNILWNTSFVYCSLIKIFHSTTEDLSWDFFVSINFKINSQCLLDAIVIGWFDLVHHCILKNVISILQKVCFFVSSTTELW